MQEAIDSVFSQTYSNIELIVVDDGSQNSTWEIIQSYGLLVRGIHKENGGISSALNFGIQHAYGAFIAWLSHDDLFVPNKIEQQIQFMTQHPECGVSYTNFEIVDAHLHHIRTIQAPCFPRQEMPRQFLRNMYINGSTTLIRKDCFNRIGLFNERLAHTQDLDMWLRIGTEYEFGHLPQVLVRSRSHPQQGSWNFGYQIIEEQATLSDTYERMGPVSIFTELERVADSRIQAAMGYEKFGDDLLQHRHWYQFACNQYQESLRYNQSNRAKAKVTATRIMIWLLGDEYISTTLGKRARFLLTNGNREEARNLSARLFIQHPLRLDALILWLSTWTPTRAFQMLRSIKRQLFPS